MARAEGAVKGAVASESDLAISNSDSLSADEVQDKLRIHSFPSINLRLAGPNRLLVGHAYSLTPSPAGLGRGRRKLLPRPFVRHLGGYPAVSEGGQASHGEEIFEARQDNAITVVPDPVKGMRRRAAMAELTVLEEKLAEVLGLAMAAQGATDKIRGMTDDESLSRTLDRMREEAEQTEQRCTELAEDLNGKKTAVLEKARETKGEATEMMSTYLGNDAEALDGFEFLTMAEAAEVGHWSVLQKLNERAQDRRLAELVEWARPIQERHFKEALDGSLELAAREDPNAPA